MLINEGLSGVSTGRCIPVDRGWPYGREGGSDIRLSLGRVGGFSKGQEVRRFSER